LLFVLQLARNCTCAGLLSGEFINFSHVPFHFDHLSTQPTPILIFFCTFAGIKKQKLSAYHVFRKYPHKIIYSGTNFSSFFDCRLILSITVQSIFAVEPSAWTRWKGILIENITQAELLGFGFIIQNLKVVG
jgi:hypothetical protein